MHKRSNIPTVVLEVGKRIKQLRISSGYKSYETFANDYDLDRKQYWRMEQGTNITLKTIIKIIKIHKLSIEDFFKGIK